MAIATHSQIKATATVNSPQPSNERSASSPLNRIQQCARLYQAWQYDGGAYRRRGGFIDVMKSTYNVAIKRPRRRKKRPRDDDDDDDAAVAGYEA